MDSSLSLENKVPSAKRAGAPIPQYVIVESMVADHSSRSRNIDWPPKGKSIQVGISVKPSRLDVCGSNCVRKVDSRVRLPINCSSVYKDDPASSFQRAAWYMRRPMMEANIIGYQVAS